MTDYSNQITEKKKGYYFNYEGNEDVNLRDLDLKKKKPLYITLNNTSGSAKDFDSSYHYTETITVTGGKYSLQLAGTNSNKTVKLGNTAENSVMLGNIGKNKVIAGDGGNSFYSNGAYANNNITAGKGKDYYLLYHGTTKITDKGGKNDYTITGGINTIIDKGSDGSTFEVKCKLSDDGGTTTIKSGDGVDELKVYNNNKPHNPQIITADLGKGNDKVLVDYDPDPQSYNVDVSTVNVKTGKGQDTVEIKAGKKNTVNTGDDSDTVDIYGGQVNNINTGNGVDTINIHEKEDNDTVSIIKAGKGDDIITVSSGTNTIYGEDGKDHIILDAFGNNTVYGGGDIIEVTSIYDASIENTIYAYKDTITLSGANNTVYTKKSGNTITLNNGTNEINSEKGGNKIIANEGTNTIHSEKSKNTITLVGGVNTVYGGKGNTISSTAASANNTIYAYKDNLTLTAGTNNVHTKNGGNSINIENNTIGAAGTYNIYLENGNNTVNAKAGKEGSTQAVTVNISAGKNTINLDEYTVLTLTRDDNLNIAQTINIKGHAFASISLGSGDDIIKDESEANVINGWSMNTGLGNDKFYISNGTNKQMNGGGGNDTFTIYSGNSHKIYGGDDNDTFNIKGGTSTQIYGEQGDDTYNLNMQTGSVTITENDGTNTINVAKKYEGVASAYKNISTDATYSVKFDKSYKLTSSANVDVDVIKTTSDSNITLYRDFYYNSESETGYFSPGAMYQFITNVKDEISDKTIDDRYVQVAANALSSVNIGGENYNINLDELQGHLVAWFTDHSTYADSNAVFTGKDANDIQSLMAVYTKDTANCFIKA